MSDTTDGTGVDICHNCGSTLAPDTRQCPSCLSPTRKSKPRRFKQQIGFGRRHFRHLLIALILLVLPHVPHGFKIVPYRLLLPTSELVLEAVTRANNHPETEAFLGRPVSAGWLSRGYVRSDETGWSEGKIWIPVSGVRASGMLYVGGGQADSPWVFSQLRLVREDGRELDLLAPTKQASLLPMSKNVEAYIVPLGDVQGLGLAELPDFYRRQYGLAVEVLAPIPLEREVRNTARDQLIFEELVALMRRRLPKLAENKSAFLIGVTDEDMYIRKQNWDFAYTAYDLRNRAGVVSSHRFVPEPLAGNEVLFRSRIRKMVSRTIGFVVFDFPRSDDPSSVVYKDLYGSSSADLMSERLEGLGALAVVEEFKTGHGMAPGPVEIIPHLASFDYSKVDGRYPCLRIARVGLGPAGALDAALTKCDKGLRLDKELDEIEVDLRGNLITRTTDLAVAGETPLTVTRCYRAWDTHSRTLGRNTALSWDLFPVGSRQPYTYIDVVPCDGYSFRYERISKGTGYADAVYEHRLTNTSFLGSRISWNGNGWDLKLRDGSLYLFPESYYAKKPVDGALIGFRDNKGIVVKMQREERRNLKKISTADGRSISFEHDNGDRLIAAQDHQGRKVTYLYDHGGRLSEVRGLKSITRYGYEDVYLMYMEENSRRIADFDYQAGRISRLTLTGRGSYQFRYEFDSHDQDQVRRAVVTGPEGSIRTVDIPAERSK
jgi:YD repeat-containing protein